MSTKSLSRDLLLMLKACGLATGILGSMFLGLGATTYSAGWLQSQMLAPSYAEQVVSLSLTEDKRNCPM